MKEFDALKPYLERKRDLRYLSSIIYYDLQTRAPAKTLGKEAELANDLSAQIAEISQDPEYIKLVKAFDKAPGKNPEQQRLSEILMKEISFMEKVTIEQYSAWNKSISDSNAAWRECRMKNDFASFLPAWEKAIQAQKEMCEIKKGPEHKTLYDVCLDDYEPGETEEQVTAVFEPLKKALIELLPEAMKRQQSLSIPPVYPHSIAKQRELTPKLLELIRYDLSRGAIAESAHPFSDGLSINDARITTNYDYEDIHGNLSTVLHEGGHCMEFQNWPQSHYDNYVEMTATAAVCETHSRFYENILGKSRELAPHLLRLCQETFGGEFLNMTEDEFYNGENVVKPSLIRCDADELTYSLHIIIRFEIERDLINGKIEAKDVPEIWNKKYKDYLGIDVPDYANGCMQDTHWSEDLFGYFPSYALGNLYGAQILNAMKKDLNVSKFLKEGNLEPIRKWFAEKDFAYDYLHPEEWIVRITGEKLNPQYFIDYLKSKFLA
ncbi:MAG: carboxypeptidase M32 [Bacilli bacterium]|nr:carboxypeptidase M32 [Bacilli bacterium]